MSNFIKQYVIAVEKGSRRRWKGRKKISDFGIRIFALRFL